MITAYFNRKTGEVFVTDNSSFLDQELFASGRRKREDFTTCNTTGFIQVKPEPPANVTTFDDPNHL